MARTTTLTDDMDGSPDAFERRFTIGGTDYSVDLTDENYAAMLQAIQPWRSIARTAKKTRANRAPVLNAEDRAKIREWAEANGKKLAPRGRFPNALVHEYYEEQERLEADAWLRVQVPAMAGK